MIDKYSITLFTCCAIGIILNGIGLFLLFNYKYARIDLTQRYILINLCCIDLSLSIFLIIDRMLILFKVSYSHNIFVLSVCLVTANTGYYGATFSLIMDRYLHIRLNIKYVVYCSKKKILIATMILWVLFVLSGSLFEVYQVKHIFVIYAVFDSIILLFSTYVYTNALLLFKKQKANVRSNQYDKGIFKGLAISAAIILAFAVLVAIPDSLLAITSINGNLNFNEKVYRYTSIVFPISLWTDASIYIFLSPKVRFVLKKKLKCLFGNGRNKTKRNKLYYITS